MIVTGGNLKVLAKSAVVALMLSMVFALAGSARFETGGRVLAENCGDPAALDWYTIDRVNRDKPFYQAASAATGVPWELLAAIHYRETGFGHTNPGNGQGIFQFVNGDGGPYPPGPVSDAEFTRQLTFMANRVQNDYVWRSGLPYNKRRLRATNEDAFRIKDVLFSYNGRASVYARQAATFGFNSATEPYEGSPYVMNRFDCARKNMPMITRDFGGVDGIDTRLGAYTLYAELVGGGANNRSYDAVADGSGFNAGNILSDDVFFDSSAMDAAAIQAFLAEQVPQCDTNGDLFYRGTVRRDVSASDPPPYVCLRDYRNSETGQSAGQVISTAAVRHGVNPQVILSLIEAQKRLVTDDWPWASQYRNAGCNSASVNLCWWDQNAGFANQVEFIASKLAEFSDPGVAGNQYRVGQTYQIPYSSAAGCEGVDVRIENRATAALYNYTPFQPNAAALANPYGSGDSCSIRQNLKLYLNQTNWFTDSVEFVSFDTPRWMRVTQDIQKTRLTDNALLPSESFQPGRDIYFVDKFTNEAGEAFFRTRLDRNASAPKGIPKSAVADISYESFDEPRYLQITQNTKLVNPFTEEATTAFMSTGERIMFDKKVTILGRRYFASSADARSAGILAIPKEATSAITFEDFGLPRYMQFTSNSQAVQPAYKNRTVSESTTSGTIRFFDKKITVGNETFYQTTEQSDAGSIFAYPKSSLTNIEYSSMSQPRWMSVSADAQTIRPDSNSPVQIRTNSEMLFDSYIELNGKRYYRNYLSSLRGINVGISSDYVRDISFEEMDLARPMRLTSNTTKTVLGVDGVEGLLGLPEGMIISFETKTRINGEVYLRTAADTTKGRQLGIPISVLEEVN